MSWLSELDIFTVGLTLLQFIGERIEYTSRLVIAFRVLNCAIIVTVFTFVVSNLNDPKSERFVTGLEQFTTVFHTLFKYLTFMYFKNDFKHVMAAKRRYFWKIPCGNKDLSRKIRNMYQGINLLQTVMLADAIFITVMYLLSPYLNPRDPFLVPSNIFFDSIIIDVIVLACQYHFFGIVLFIVLGYDFVYLSLCTELSVQVKLLKYELKEVFTKAREDAVFGVWRCVKQHNFLLSMHDKMQKIYSNVLLFHYFLSLITVCFDMYQFFVGQNALSHEVQKFLSLAGVTGQFAFYCVPAELLSLEFTDIAQDLYMSKWYKIRPEIQKLMLPIMVKCQRPHYFSAAGLLDINIDAFGSVIRKAFTFCAVIRNVLDK